MFPDEATLFLAGIEDQDYKEEKIGCASRRSCLAWFTVLIPALLQSGTMSTASTTRASRKLRSRNRWWTPSTSRPSSQTPARLPCVTNLPVFPSRAHSFVPPRVDLRPPHGHQGGPQLCRTLQAHRDPK